ncbi:hypothetical protein ACEWY4_003077 [Coilia grayii]|uniref:Cytochrome P450 n=1 Tax=Coilia grayii TaxID=363190 RepID=A0ABD1KQN5_9TELE
MAILEGLLQGSSAFPLLVAALLLLLAYLYAAGNGSTEKGKEPPGPKRLPILGNLLQLDLQKPYETLCELSKTYGSVFTVHFGPQKIVILSGYKTVKEALVSRAEEFGDRGVSPIFKELNNGHGLIFTNGDQWKEMRRFALTNLRDFGMGKKSSEEKIIEETRYLSDVFDTFKGKAFDTTQPVNYAVSNIISSIVYGSRFEYSDPRFKDMVNRANEQIRLGGTPAIQLYNMFPFLGPLLKNWRRLKSKSKEHIEEMRKLIKELQDTMNPHEQRGFVDSFLMRKQKVEVSVAFPLLVAALLLLLAYLYATGNGSTEKGKEPPGPKRLPILGNLLQLDLQKPYETLCEFSKKYGSIFTVHFGPQKMVVLAGYKTVKEALVSHADEFGDRANVPIFMDLYKGLGIVFSNGDNWKEMRRFALSNLRDFGMGKKGSEEKIIEETQYLSEVFESFKGKAFDTTQTVNYAASNIISSIVYGSRFEYGDSRFKDMVHRANENIRLEGSASIHLYNMFPWLGPVLRNWRKLISTTKEHFEEIRKLIKELQDSVNPHEQRGLVDCFLMRKQKVEESGQKETFFHQENMVISVAHLFAAGTDTTGTTVRWGLLLMAKYPHIQDRVQEEIDRVIGGRQPVVEDRKSLPYTDAVIHETQRFANIVPMSLPHTTSCDVHLQGYFIKKGTTVIPLLTSVLRDESEWAKPYVFHPEHFLDDQGRFIKRDAFMPFSAGRRVCLGESLARMELFLFFTSLLQRFRFTASPGVLEDELDLTPTVGLTLNPSPHKLCAISRI